MVSVPYCVLIRTLCHCVELYLLCGFRLLVYIFKSQNVLLSVHLIYVKLSSKCVCSPLT